MPHITFEPEADIPPMYFGWSRGAPIPTSRITCLMLVCVEPLRGAVVALRSY